MTEKEIKRLSRADLLQLLLEESRENERLKSRLAELEEKVARRELNIENAGSLAEAVFLINGVVEAAQAAADQYLENLGIMSDKAAAENALRKNEGTEPADAQSNDEENADETAHKYSENKNSNAESIARLEKETLERCKAEEEKTAERCRIAEEKTAEKCRAAEEETAERCRRAEEETLKKCNYVRAKTKAQCEKMIEQARSQSKNMKGE